MAPVVDASYLESEGVWFLPFLCDADKIDLRRVRPCQHEDALKQVRDRRIQIRVQQRILRALVTLFAGTVTRLLLVVCVVLQLADASQARIYRVDQRGFHWRKLTTDRFQRGAHELFGTACHDGGRIHQGPTILHGKLPISESRRHWVPRCVPRKILAGKRQTSGRHPTLLALLFSRISAAWRVCVCRQPDFPDCSDVLENLGVWMSVGVWMSWVSGCRSGCREPTSPMPTCHSHQNFPCPFWTPPPATAKGRSFPKALIPWPRV
jgi:hypothetical protein